MAISLTIQNSLARSSSIYIDRQGHLRKTTFVQKICRISPKYANKQDVEVAKFFYNALTTNSFKTLSSHKRKVLIRCTSLFNDKILHKRFCFKNAKIKKLKNSLTNELHVHLLAKSLHLPLSILRQNPKFVHFAITNHLHHRVDRHYQKNNLGIRYNKEIREFEMPFKEGKSVNWKKWDSFPLDKRGRIIGYDLLAYGWEKHDNATWKTFKPFKILTQDDFKKRFPNKSLLTSPSIELVTTIPTFSKPPGQYGHVYVNFYVPYHDKIQFYSIGYDLTNISVPDVLEFIDRKRVTSLRPISVPQWVDAKRFIEIVQKIHKKKNKKRTYSHPDKKAMNFYKKHMRKNCGNFAVALFEDLTGIQNLYTLFPLMRVLFPKPFHYVSDWIEGHLPTFLQHLIQKVNIVLRGVIPWHLIPKQKKLSQIAG